MDEHLKLTRFVDENFPGFDGTAVDLAIIALGKLQGDKSSTRPSSRSLVPPPAPVVKKSMYKFAVNVLYHVPGGHPQYKRLDDVYRHQSPPTLKKAAEKSADKITRRRQVGRGQAPSAREGPARTVHTSTSSSTPTAMSDYVVGRQVVEQEVPEAIRQKITLSVSSHIRQVVGRI
jgi:hypothetical protein